MATTNIWQQFKSLIPEGARAVVTITSKNGNGTSTAELRNGTSLIVQGESVEPGKKALVQEGTIQTGVPDLQGYEAEI